MKSSPQKRLLDIVPTRQVFITLVMSFCFIQTTNAQKCSAIHACPAGYTCVNFHCEKTITPPPPPPPPCTCVRPISARCAPKCGFLSEENNGPLPITISQESASQIVAINFQVEDAASISLKIYDAAGRLIRTLVAEKIEQGSHQVEWNKRDEDGNTVSAGIYILQLDTPNRSETKKLPVSN